MTRNHRYLLAVSTLSLGCNGNASLDNDQGGQTSSGGMGASSSGGTGGGSSGAGKGSSAGGSKASAGAGGSGNDSAGASADAAGMGKGAAGTGAGGAGSGGKSSGAGTGGSSGTETGAGGEGATGNVEPKAVTDRDAAGEGPCEGQTLDDVIAAIHEKWPEFADVTQLYDPNLIGGGSFIYPFSSESGFSLAFLRGSGDCPAGCIDKKYWYFETNESCEPEQVGHYSRTYSSAGNCWVLDGEPHWGVPEQPFPNMECPAA